MPQMTVRVKVDGLEDLQGAINSLTTKGRQNIIEVVKKTAINVQTDAKEAITTMGAVDTGNLRQKIYTKATNGGLGAEVYPAAEYGIYVHEGRRAGARMPPAGALLPWMGHHGISASQEYAVRKGIGAKGIKGRPFMKVAWDKNKDKFREDLAEALNRAAKESAR